MAMKNPQAILLMGATATGKTDLAVKLAERFPVEIISVDSALIYRGMDIGTAKPDPQLLQKAPHFLIDFLEPTESWSAWEFVHTGLKLIHEINNRGHIPLLVGGTMMYFHALQQGMNELPQSNDKIRQQLTQQFQQHGLVSLYQELRDIDPEMASRLKATDQQRIMRALEVYHVSGTPMSELLQNSLQKPGIDFQRIILDVPDRQELHQCIEQRFVQMLEQGFEQEVIGLRQRGDLNLGLPSMRCVGYRQMWMYLDGNYKYNEMVKKSVIATRQLAKRQLTWLRKYKKATRLDYRDYSIESVYQMFK